MRVFVLAFVLLVAFYIAFVIFGAAHHKSDPPPASAQRPTFAQSVAQAWPIFPPFLKVAPTDVRVFGAAIAGPGKLSILPGSTATLVVLASSRSYRLMRLQFDREQQPVFNTIGLTYPSIANPPPSGVPEPLTNANPSQLIVLPSSGGSVTLTCNSGSACFASFE